MKTWLPFEKPKVKPHEPTNLPTVQGVDDPSNQPTEVAETMTPSTVTSYVYV